MTDIKAVQRVSRLILVDELTGLYKRRFLRQYLGERLAQLAQARTPLCVVMLDVDGFKQIKDTHGHLEGDRILKRIAHLVRDMLPQGAFAIRFAGDEFIVLLEAVDGAGGTTVAESLRERVAAHLFISGKGGIRVPAAVSLGVAAYPEDVPHPFDLIEAADQALYRSKRTGKNCVSRWSRGTLPPEVEVLTRFPCPRLVGRTAELAELERPLSDAPGGRNRLFLVEAERGLGKSRPLAEVRRNASERGLRCFFRHCLETHQAIPYSSLTSVLGECFDREPGRLQYVKGRLSAQMVRELGTVIPSLAEEGVREPVDLEERRRLLFHGMADVLCLLSEHAPLILVLDDLHFADEASLEVLRRLLDREEGQVVVCAAARPPDPRRPEQAAPASGRVADRLGESPNVTRLTLPSLTLPEVAQMVAEILKDHTASPVFVQRLSEESRGIPLFVEETLKRRPRFLGLVPGLPETVRATAARALGEIAVEEARAGLVAALQGPSPTVRSAARLALSRIGRGSEAR